MPSTLDEQHVLPPDESHRDEYKRLLDAMAPITGAVEDATHPVAAAVRQHIQSALTQATLPRLTGPDGTSVELPEAVYNILRRIVEDLNNGRAVLVQTTDPVLTTGQAADILGVSRVTLVKMLDEGVIPSFMRGRHRRVRLPDVMAYEEESRRQRTEILHEMSREAAESGLDDATNFMPTRD